VTAIIPPRKKKSHHWQSPSIT